MSARPKIPLQQTTKRTTTAAAAARSTTAKPAASTVSVRDKLILALRKNSCSSAQQLPSTKLLFASLLVDIGSGDAFCSNDSYALADALFASAKYLSASVILEKFPLAPKFILLNALCHVLYIPAFLFISL